tara:strand:- start:355 stop:570 length:216 start_codon:yes stop_codon:yes gene_type:complete
MLKRDNWTNEEVISFLKDMRLYGPSDQSYNTSLNAAVMMFEDFMRDESSCGATAYETEIKEIVVIGPVLPR